MSDRPDYQRAVNIAAQTLKEVAVDISAQSINQLGIDIESQSVGDLAVDIASQSLSEVDIDIASQSLSQLGIDIESQSVGDIAVDLASQSLSDVGIDINAQSLGDLDINVNGQSQGVETGGEFEASADSLSSFNAIATVPANDTENDLGFNNNALPRKVLEFVSFRFNDNYTDKFNVKIEVQDSDGNPVFAWFGNPQNFPAVFDPGLTVPAGGQVRIIYENDSSSSASVNTSGVLRDA
jgi:hypothetical protein